MTVRSRCRLRRFDRNTARSTDDLLRVVADLEHGHKR
jgi:hypothetical protein